MGGEVGDGVAYFDCTQEYSVEVVPDADSSVESGGDELQWVCGVKEDGGDLRWLGGGCRG